jgi:osmotically-inducible protein OsmY
MGLSLWWASLSGCAVPAQCSRAQCRSDASITSEVRTRLAEHASLGAPNLISVQTVNGVVYLRGLVSTPYQIESAGALARQTAGVKAVENQLAVDEAR